MKKNMFFIVVIVLSLVSCKLNFNGDKLVDFAVDSISSNSEQQPTEDLCSELDLSPQQCINLGQHNYWVKYYKDRENTSYGECGYTDRNYEKLTWAFSSSKLARDVDNDIQFELNNEEYFSAQLSGSRGELLIEFTDLGFISYWDNGSCIEKREYTLETTEVSNNITGDVILDQENESVSQYSTIFSDDFSGNLSQWTLWGDPSPYIDFEIGNPAPSLQNNGDGWYPSGLNSNQGFTLTTGMEISFDLQISNISGGHHWSGVFLSRDWEFGEDHEDAITLASMGADTSAIHLGCQTIPLEDTNFHSVKIVVLNDYSLQVYLDDFEKPLCKTDPLNHQDFINVPLVIGGREGHVDNVKVTIP